MASHSEQCDYFNVNSKLLNHLSVSSSLKENIEADFSPLW